MHLYKEKASEQALCNAEERVINIGQGMAAGLHNRTVIAAESD